LPCDSSISLAETLSHLCPKKDFTVQFCYNPSELGFLPADTRQVTAGRSHSQTLLCQDFPTAIFSLSGGPQGGGRGKEGPGDEAAPEVEWAAIFPSGEAPRAQQREPHSGESCWDCYGWRRDFSFFFNINKCTPGTSFCSLPPSLHANVNLKVAQKLLQSFQSPRIKKISG